MNAPGITALGRRPRISGSGLAVSFRVCVRVNVVGSRALGSGVLGLGFGDLKFWGLLFRVSGPSGRRIEMLYAFVPGCVIILVPCSYYLYNNMRMRVVLARADHFHHNTDLNNA